MRIGTTKAKRTTTVSSTIHNAEERNECTGKKCVLITVVIIKTAVSSLLFRRLVVMLIFQCVFFLFVCLQIMFHFKNRVVTKKCGDAH